MLRGPELPLKTLLCLALLAVPCGDVAGQTIEGRVFDAQNDRAITTAIIRLVDRSGDARLATNTDSAGLYQIAVPELGRYRLQAQAVGYEFYESGALELSMTDVLSIDLALRPAPIPIRGVEVSTDQANRRIRDFLGTNPALLRIRPVRSTTIRDHWMRGNGLSGLIDALQIPNMQILRTREGPCYQFRGRGCVPVYLDGARLNRAPNSMLPLEMLSAVVVLLPNELIAYPAGAVHLFTIGFMR